MEQEAGPSVMVCVCGTAKEKAEPMIAFPTLTCFRRGPGESGCI